MEQIHTLDTRETGKYGDLQVAMRSHPPEDFKMFVGMVESHGRFVERVFYIEHTVITRQIIIKNAPGSNDYIFFSVIHRSKGFVLLGLREFIIDNQYRLWVYMCIFQKCIDRKIVGEDKDDFIQDLCMYRLEKRNLACVMIEIDRVTIPLLRFLA